jgi:hypothetical protein
VRQCGALTPAPAEHAVFPGCRDRPPAGAALLLLLVLLLVLWLLFLLPPLRLGVRYAPPERRQRRLAPDWEGDHAKTQRRKGEGLRRTGREPEPGVSAGAGEGP